MDINVLGSETVGKKVLQSYKIEKRILQCMQVGSGSCCTGEYTTWCNWHSTRPGITCLYVLVALF